MRHTHMATCDRLSIYLLLTAFGSAVLADSNDWIRTDYVLQQASGGSSATTSARQEIINSAGSSAKSGPWTVVDKGSVLPPSGNGNDYLSWAPYHWPECNWCTKGTTHLSNPGAGDNDPDNTGDDSADDSGDDSGDDANAEDPSSDPYEDGGADNGDGTLIVIRDHKSAFSRRRRGIFGSHRRVARLSRAALKQAIGAHGGPSTSTSPVSESVPPAPILGRDTLPTGLLSAVPSSIATSMPNLQTSQTSSSVGTVAGTLAPAEAPAKTQTAGGGSCTPSPTRSLAPSATWTTCPYEVHDGKLNPDVRTLPDSPAAVSMSQSVLYNGLAYAMTKTSAYSQSAASFLDAFFLSTKTAMRPNMNFGQMVRGPGADHQVGTFTGVLDMRGLVKVVNGIALLKAAGSPDWTSARDQAMTSWMNQYISWLVTSDIGKQTASKANNHISFYVNQMTAAKMYLGDTKGAVTTLQNYFSNQYLDQIAASGEQPFEAVRTRPYHYRCFNLEAMITNAKMGDQLGMDFWSAKSKYGATIQTALDYTMGLDPKDEDVSDIFPHVAAVAAAYGDPKGKYAAFLQKQVSNYKSTSFWFYDQTSALPNSPAAHTAQKREDGSLDAALSHLAGTEDAVVNAVLDAAQIAFACPAVFATAPEVEVDDDIWVTCDQLKPFYELVAPLGTNSSVLGM